MRKTVLLLTAFIIFQSTGFAQDWFTSFDVAKRLALVQNKMLFVMWEDAIKEPYFILLNDENGKVLLVDLTDSDVINETIWEYFIPVHLPESAFGEFLDKYENKGYRYLDKLEDDSIKIMDVNGNILNTKTLTTGTENLNDLITTYALNTSYLNGSYRNYLQEKNFTTAFVLGSKYLDVAVFAENRITRSELVKLAQLYLKEARGYLSSHDFSNKKGFEQKLDLEEIRSSLIVNKAKRAKRLLKKYDTSDIDKINESLFVFVKYTTFILLEDNENATLWKDKLSSASLKKAELLITNHIPNWKPF